MNINGPFPGDLGKCALKIIKRSWRTQNTFEGESDGLIYGLRVGLVPGMQGVAKNILASHIQRCCVRMTFLSKMFFPQIINVCGTNASQVPRQSELGSLTTQICSYAHTQICSYDKLSDQ